MEFDNPREPLTVDRYIHTHSRAHPARPRALMTQLQLEQVHLQERPKCVIGSHDPGVAVSRTKTNADEPISTGQNHSQFHIPKRPWIRYHDFILIASVWLRRSANSSQTSFLVCLGRHRLEEISRMGKDRSKQASSLFSLLHCGGTRADCCLLCNLPQQTEQESSVGMAQPFAGQSEP